MKERITFGCGNFLTCLYCTASRWIYFFNNHFLSGYCLAVGLKLSSHVYPLCWNFKHTVSDHLKPSVKEGKVFFFFFFQFHTCFPNLLHEIARFSFGVNTKLGLCCWTWTIDIWLVFDDLGVRLVFSASCPMLAWLGNPAKDKWLQ